MGDKSPGDFVLGGGGFHVGIAWGELSQGEVSLNRNHPSHKYDRSP